MKRIKKMVAIETGWFSPKRLNAARPQADGRPVRFRLRGELGLRLARCIWRIQNEPPYCIEHVLGQIAPQMDSWSQFPRFHGDMAGRWLLAMTYASSGWMTPPSFLRHFVQQLLALQNTDGSFGRISSAEEPVNMHKAYGNGWLLKALAQYAITFGDNPTASSAGRLAEHYRRALPLWSDTALRERASGFYAVSPSCFYHALDGLMTLYRLTRDRRHLTLAGKFIAHLTPLSQADHCHMYLSIRRGLIEYVAHAGDVKKLRALGDELREFRRACVLETGGTPERIRYGKAKRGRDETFTDEACALFDWELDALRLHELTHETDWLEAAILNLENHIYFNQLPNGGFGDQSLGPSYPALRHEAPWCCTLFGPYGLIEAASLLLQECRDTVHIRHLVSGDFILSDGTQLTLNKNDAGGAFTIARHGGKRIHKVALYRPFWLETGTSAPWLEMKLPMRGTLTIPYAYRLWTAKDRIAPERQSGFKHGQAGILFFGPWLLSHRFEFPGVNLQFDARGFAKNFHAQPIRGIGLQGESWRVTVPSNVEINPHDVNRGVGEEDGKLWLYPLRDRECCWRSNTRVRLLAR